MNLIRHRVRVAVVALAAICATAGTLFVASPAVAVTASSVVRQPSAPGAAQYTIKIYYTYDASDTTTKWKIEFDLPSGSVVVPWSSFAFTNNGNHWVGTFKDGGAAPPDPRYGVAPAWLAVTGSVDPTNIKVDGRAVPYTVLTDTTPPTTPTNVYAWRSTYPGIGTGVSLSWTKSTDNYGVSGYEVAINGTVYTTTTQTLVYLTNPKVTTTFAVRAFDPYGNYSAYATFTLPAA
jgi:chitinase